MEPMRDEDLPKMFLAGGHSYECITNNDFFHGARVFMIAHSEHEAKMMFQKQHGREAMKSISKFKLMERI